MRLLDYNIAAPEGAVSVSGGYSIQGYKGGKGGGGSTRTPTEDQDNLHSIAYASVIDLVSAGPIHGFVDQNNPLRSVYLDNTPIQNEDGSLNFQDVQLEFRAGTQDQRYIPGFPAAESSTAVNVELRSDQPFTRAIQNVHISGVRVGLSVRGLKQQSTETGDITGYRVEYVIELSTDGSAFAEVLRGAFDGKTTQQYSRSHRIDLPRASTGWSLRVRRLTSNSSNSTISDVTYVDSITEVTDAKLRRPMSACVGIRVNAKQFQSIPTRAYHLYLRVVRVPSNYDAWTRSYAGTWDGTFKMSWTDNPAWVFYDLATNACDGLGRLLPAGWVDRWALYQIARYCDELVPDGKGGTEPRFSCNVYLQDKAEAWKVLQDLASVFRGMAYYAHGSVLAVADMPRDAVYTYSNANVVDGQFNYTGSGLKTRYTVALVSWNDEMDMGRAKVEVVEDPEGIARYGVRQVELTAFGCTSQGQAQRLGRSALFTSRMETESVTFAVGLSGTLAQPGQVIEVADAHLAGRRIGGLIQSATVNAVTLDAPARVSAGDRLTVVLPSGASQTRVVAASVGQGAELQVIPVATPFSQAPQSEAAWSISAPDPATQKYRVLTVSEGAGLQHTITALQYVDGKHAAIDYETRVEAPPISVVPPPVQNLPANVAITSYHVLAQGQARHNAVISWDAAANAVAYEVQWRRDNSEWVSMSRTGSTSVEVPNIYAGGYVARVRAINVLDVSSLWATSALTQLNGEVSAPQPITHLITASIPWGIRLNWGFPAGPNIIERTEIRYSSTQDFADSLPAGSFAYPSDSFEQTGLAVTTQHFFWARLIDKNGTQGPWYPAESAPGVRGVPSQVASEYNELITEEIVAGGLGEVIMGDIRDIPNIRDAVGEINIDLGELNGRVDQINGQVQELLNAGEWDPAAAYAVGTVVFADGKMYRAKKAVPAGTPVSDAAHWELIGDYASIADGLAALAVQAQETISRVENAEGLIQANAEQISTVAGQVNNPETGLGALGSAVQSMRTQVGQLQDGLQSLSEATTALSSRVDGLDQAQQGLATAVSSLGTRVAATEGQLDSQASSITQLGASVTNADAKAVAAQQAAAAAADAAGAKGEVIFRSTAPPAAKRLAQNLWIDTAGNANTPKRWNGSAWVAVTDKAATDAAAAAVAAKAAADAAQATANQKADASAVNTLTTRVEQAEGGLASQGQAVTALQNTVNDPNTGLAATAGALNDTKSRVTSIEGKQEAQATNQLVLNAEVKRLQSDEDAYLESVLNQWQTKASLAEFKQVQADENRALAESITTLTAVIGQDSAAVEEIMRSLVELDGKIAAAWGVKLQANQNGIQYVSGVGLDLTNESGVMQSTFAVLADRFAVMHATNGSPVTVFSVQGGASILNTALIGTASITDAKIADAAITKAKIRDAAVSSAKIEDAAITSAKIQSAAIKTAHIGHAEVDTLRIAGSAVTIQSTFKYNGSNGGGTRLGQTRVFYRILDFPVFYPHPVGVIALINREHSDDFQSIGGQFNIYVNGTLAAKVVTASYSFGVSLPAGNSVISVHDWTNENDYYQHSFSPVSLSMLAAMR
ncbi:TipJ family phage tail tip protein [Alcaligenes faecalis]|uniref:TipJ family phage tail tip protein n=1 Tax=Alcaligenes faecalis TaxID=511 RepID=UPI001EF04E51|nr:phage tail protein [Alcaligenes faecalis]ULH08585.1 phage tail protein [Alcaligenes faecalis]